MHHLTSCRCTLSAAFCASLLACTMAMSCFAHEPINVVHVPMKILTSRHLLIAYTNTTNTRKDMCKNQRKETNPFCLFPCKLLYPKFSVVKPSCAQHCSLCNQKHHALAANQARHCMTALAFMMLTDRHSKDRVTQILLALCPLILI